MNASSARQRETAPAAVGEPDIALRVITQPDAFLALADEWDALFARCALPHQVFQSHVVLRHWEAHYRERNQRLSIVAAWRDGRLAMVWPLVRQARFGLDILRFMGIPVAQFGDVLVARDGDEDRLMQLGWRAVAGLGADLFEARKLRADSALARSGLLADAIVLERQNAPFADLALRVGADGPGPAYGARDRSNHRRRLRRLAEQGVITFEAFGPGEKAVAFAKSAVAMKQQALAHHGVLAPAIDDPRFGAFFASLASDAAGGSPLRVSTIASDGTPIGIDLSFDCKTVSFGHVIATDSEHQRSGVGGLLVHHVFASARARGNAIFDLLAPADAYKCAHADGMTAITDRVTPLSLRGRLICGLGFQHLRPALKTAAKRLPAGLTGVIAGWSTGTKG